MPGDYFKEDILENAISARQKERRERREAQIRRKELQEKRSAEAAVKARRRRRLFFAAVVVVVAAGFLVGRSIVDIIRLRREKAEAEARLEALKVRIELLESELQRVTSDEYIEQQARSQLKMIFRSKEVRDDLSTLFTQNRERFSRMERSVAWT